MVVVIVIVVGSAVVVGTGVDVSGGCIHVCTPTIVVYSLQGITYGTKAYELLGLAAECSKEDELQQGSVFLEGKNFYDFHIEPVWTWEWVVILDVSNNKLRVVPDLNLPVLDELNISYNLLEQLPARLILPKLRVLEVSHNKLRVVPKLDLPVLEGLDISHNLLEQLPARLLLPKLQSLDLPHNKLRVVPELDLPVLVHLDISDNHLEQLPARLLLPKLQALYLVDNILRVVPELDLPALERLDISDNELEQLPARLLLPKLQCLDLSRNTLRVVPELNLPLLEELDISRNRLEQLSARLLLPKLEKFDLSNNNFVKFPRVDPNELPQLKHLNLRNNDLFDIVAAALELCGASCTLESLDLAGNKTLLVPPLKIIIGGKDTCEFFVVLNQLVLCECSLNLVVLYHYVSLSVVVVLPLGARGG